MAKNLSNNGIVLNQVIYPQHVSQSVDAFTGADDYDITISGSFTVTGSTAIKGNVNVDGSTTMYGNVVAPNLTSTAQTNVVTFNPINGQLYYTASSAISPATASNAVSASYSVTASYAERSLSASYAVSASYALTASYIANAQTASYVTLAQTASFVTASGVFGPYGSNSVISSSYAVSASYASTASYVANAQTASYVTTAQTASYVTLAQTASYVTTAQTASYVLSASYAVSSSAADSAISASYSTTASFAQNTPSASNAVSASHADLADTASYAIFASSSLIANTLDKQDYLLYKNTYFANEGVKDISTALTELGSSQGSVLYIGPGSYSGADLSITTPNISLNAPESGAGPGSTITQLSGARGVTISGASTIRVRLNNLQLGTNGLTISGTLGRHRVYNCQLPQIVFTGATSDFIYFDKCDIGNITIPNTFTGFVYILNSTISGTITNNAPLGSQQLIISNTTGIPATFTTYYNAGIVYNTSNETLISATRLTASNANLTGSLLGTSSYAMQTATASYVITAQTSSFITASGVFGPYGSNSVVSSSYALTASYLTGYVSPFPFTGSAQITGSLGVTGSATINGDLVVNGTASFNVFHTTYNSSSIIYASGSTKFGDTSDDTHQFTGSLLVSGSITADSFTGTASYATQAATASFVTLAQTASYVANAQTASYVLNAVSSSFATTASYALTASFVTLAQTASFVTTAQTASYVLNAVSASFATTASHALTASFVTTAQTASFVTTAQTSSFITASGVFGPYGSNSVISSSYALTASHVTGVVAAFPYTGSAQITGSLGLTGSLNVYKSGSNVVVISGSTGPLVTVTDSISGPLLTVATGSTNILVVDSSLVTTITGSLNVQSGVTASLFGTASWALNAITSSHIVQAVSASYSATASYVVLAQTASYVANAQTASYVLNAVSSSFATTASYALTASFVTTAQTASYVLNAVSASFAATASYVNQLNQAVFISGSLDVTGSVDIYKSGSSPLVVSGSQGALFEVTDSNSGSLWTIYTGSLPIFDVSSDRTMTLSGSATITGSLTVQNGITGSLFGTASWALNAITSSHVVQSVSASFASTASYIVLAQTASFVTTAQTASYVLNAVTASYVANAQTASYVLNAVSASYATTASYVENAQTASYVTLAQTASYAVNGGVTQLFAGPNITLSPTTGVGQVTISSTGAGTYYNTSTGSYGSFYDTTTQLNPVANTPRSMSLNTTDITNGVSVSGSSSPFNTYIKVTNAGVYNIQFSAQLYKSDSGTDFIDIWLRRNGVDLMDSATNVALIGNHDRQVAAWNWFATAGAGDYYQIMWASADTDAQLLAEPATGVHPGIPSVIVTANRIDTFLSNTGSFSGSFNGVLNGTASYATQAATASYVVLAQTASFVTTAQTASYVLNAVSASFASTASYVNQLNQTVNISGSLNATGSVNLYKSGSSILTVSGSFGPILEVTDTVSGSLWTIYTGSLPIFDLTSARILTLSGSAIITGSLNVQNGITGSLFGTATTASFVTLAQTASFVTTAQTASFVTLAQTASYVLNAVSSSFAATASYVNQLNQAVLISGSINATGSVNVYKSGSIVFTVSGSTGPLFDIADVVSGSLFTVWTGSNRILQTNSDYTTILGGASNAAALFATNKTTANSGSTTIYNVPTASYDSIHVDYNIRSGSTARAGNILAIWSGSSVNQIETSASSFGDTSAFTFGALVSGSNLALTGSTTTNGWTVKTIIRSI